MFTVDQLRQMYLEFFQEKGHKILPSASLIPKGDPTLLLTGAGMVPFKPFFLGKQVPEHKMVTTCQRCLRTADLEQVGVTARHGTFFEMLGNFSFGAYFKKEAIHWAWEFVTQRLKLPKEKLWVTIYLDDDEAFQIWNREVGVPEERIVRLGKEDNFWEIGVGPCGPCSELHIDRGPEFGCGSEDCSVDCDCDRFLEFWNLVFIQFFQDEAGVLHPLSQKGIDTGMGLERIAAMMQGKESIFEIDNLARIVAHVEKVAAKKSDVSLRVIADHMRSATFLASDGVIPSNEGRGYVMRRLIRRSIRHGKLMGIEGSFLAELVERIVEVMAPGYPELTTRLPQIKAVIVREEERFASTLTAGMARLEELMEASKGTISGEEAFKLHDTYGFPLELTAEIARERGFEVDEAGFEEAMAQQRERARSARGKTGYLDSDSGIYAELATEAGISTNFVGYEENQIKARVTGLIQDEEVISEAIAPLEVELILDQTPFYAESGGQLADTGTIGGDGVLFEVQSVRRPVENLIVHRGVVRKGTITVGDELLAQINTGLREDTCRNHTATHLLQAALREVLGEHVEQAGSSVSPTELRFDFKHFKALSAQELEEVEAKVNAAILENYPVGVREMSFDEAQESGATALFSEKYGDVVRVVSISDLSSELCGGTHARATGQIGLFKICSESSIASGVRRIVALTGTAALERVQDEARILASIAQKLNASIAEAPEKLSQLLAREQALGQELEKLEEKLMAQEGRDLAAGAVDISGARVLVREVPDHDGDALKLLADGLRSQLKSGVALLASRKEGKALFLAMVTEDLVKRGIHAGKLVRTVASVAGGGGGGRGDLAQAGAKNPELVPQALQAGQEEIEKLLRG